MDKKKIPKSTETTPAVTTGVTPQTQLDDPTNNPKISETTLPLPGERSGWVRLAEDSAGDFQTIWG
jgi:hypothetical protein